MFWTYLGPLHSAYILVTFADCSAQEDEPRSVRGEPALRAVERHGAPLPAAQHLWRPLVSGYVQAVICQFATRIY